MILSLFNLQTHLDISAEGDFRKHSFETKGEIAIYEIAYINHARCLLPGDLTRVLVQFVYLFIYWDFTPLSTLFQLYHGDS